MRNSVKVISLLFFLTCLFFWKIVVNPGHMLYPVQDVMEQFSVWKFLIHQTFQKYGQLPLWNPSYYSGHPFVSNVLSSMFYPINIMYLFFNPDIVFNYVFLLDIFLVGIFTFFFTKQIGLDNKSSFFSSLTFMFGAYFVDHIFAGHLANIDAIIWTPLTFLFTELLIKKRKVIFVLLLSVVLSLQVLAGHIQHAFYSNIALGIYFLVRNLQIFLKERKIKENIKIFSLFLISVVIFILLSSIQLLPSFEFFFSSTRSGGLTFESASLFSLPPYQLVGFVAPEIFGTPLDQSYWGGRNFFELTAYIGVISTILAFMALLFRKNKYVKAFLIVILFSLFYAFGKFTPFYKFFYNYIPGFSVFRIPSTTLFIYVFSMSVLSGFGFSFLFSKIPEIKKERILKFNKLLIFLLTLLLVIAFFLYTQRERILDLGEELLLRKYQNYSDTNELKSVSMYLEKIPLAYSHILNSILILIIFFFGSILLINLRVKNRLPKKFLVFLAILLLLIDLWIFWQKYLLIVNPVEIYEDPVIEEIDVSDLISVIEEDDERFRVYDSSNWILPQHLTIRRGIELVNGYDLSITDRYENFIHEMLRHKDDIKEENLSKGLMLLNSRYVITTEKIDNPDFRLVYFTNRTIKMMPRAFIATSKYETNQTYIYRNKRFLPRAYLVHDFEIIEEDGKILTELKSDGFNPLEKIILEEDPGKVLDNEGKFQEANITFYSPNKIVVEIGVDDSGFLVLSENWYPGWKAYDNGKETDILRANYILRTVFLEPGDHRVEFIYKPLSLRIGTWVTLGTVLFLIVSIIYIAIRDEN
ncbi:MAG: YfhO family protein [Candidatus Aenigmarchaeota archaeon]|nr:YfhO family protein [Candidatus Aenigmarchaeota archaeon]